MRRAPENSRYRFFRNRSSAKLGTLHKRGWSCHETNSSCGCVAGRDRIDRWRPGGRLQSCHESAGRLRSVQKLFLPRCLSRRRRRQPLSELLPAGVGTRRRAAGSEGTGRPPRRLAGDAAEHAADAVHRMALWRLDQSRRDAAELGRQPVDDGDRQHAAGPGDERRAHPALWLGRRRRQSLQQLGQARRQRPGGLQLHAEHGAARPGGALSRAPARHRAERPHRLGFSRLGDLWRELPLHHRLRPVQQPVAEEQRGERLRHADDLWRGVSSRR